MLIPCWLSVAVSYYRETSCSVVLYCLHSLEKNSKLFEYVPPGDLIYLHLMPYIVARFDVFTAALLTIHIFWNVMLCHWLNGFQHYEGTTIL
jgi:hypothetical protein